MSGVDGSCAIVEPSSIAVLSEYAGPKEYNEAIGMRVTYSHDKKFSRASDTRMSLLCAFAGIDTQYCEFLEKDAGKEYLVMLLHRPNSVASARSRILRLVSYKATPSCKNIFRSTKLHLYLVSHVGNARYFHFSRWQDLQM
jgi:hypothetical protein